MPSDVEAHVVESVQRLTTDANFVAWRDEEEPAAGDLLLINNSFIFRDVKTSKAGSCLALAVSESGSTEIVVAADFRFNADFKHLSGASSNLPSTTQLTSAIDRQLEQLGHLVFLLIGEVHDTEIVDAKLDYTGFAAAVWDPTTPDVARVDDDRIVVSRTDDEEAVWNAVSDQMLAAGQEPTAELREALGIALDQLQDKAVARVTLPSPGDTPGLGITDAILEVLREQRHQYATAVAACSVSSANASAALNDVLRISYNFASDATGFIRLIIQICDLKPIVLWGTIAEHYALSRAFHALPWSRSKRKPSLKNYHQAIADARNSAFHNLFPFRKTLRVELPTDALGAPTLQIFSEHGKKTANELTYQDKELVDVLVEFTRARERALSLTFWQRNLDVMDATIALFEKTSQFVKLLSRNRAA